MFRAALLLLATIAAIGTASRQAASPPPSTPLRYGAFTLTFSPGGDLTLSGEGWPTFKGRWTAEKDELTVSTSGPKGCEGPGRYRLRVEGTRVAITLTADDCVPRRMILHNSSWLPDTEKPVVPERRIVRRGPEVAPRLQTRPAKGQWPSFRGPNATGIADGQNLPDAWDVKTGANIRWRTPIPGLAHASPIVWGDRVFVTTAVSSRGGATFKPGLYGDGDASDDRSSHKWVLYALDKATGRIVWERVAFEGEPHNRRHVKSTYASATPATDGRVVVAWFGSQGIFACDMDGNRIWTVDLGRVDIGAYDVPAYEWGPASSPIIWNGLVFVQVDTQADSFVLALDARTGRTIWKTDRQELPSWGTPTIVSTPAGDELVTNASNYIRAYDPRTGKELWKLGGSSKITAPTPFAADGLVVIASGRAPERPLFVVRPGGRGDLTLAKDQTGSDQVAWSRAGRGSYMPTPLAYRGILYVLNNNGVFDAYELNTGSEVYRQRLEPVGSGFSASPVAADGRIYLTSEDGEIIVLAAGREFKRLGAYPMGELVMATPAVAEGTMYVRGVSTLFAIGRAN